MRILLLLLMILPLFSQELPKSFGSAEEALTWAKKHIGEKVTTATAKSNLSEALVVWVESDYSGKSIKALTICRKLTDARWNFVRLETFEDYKPDGAAFDNFGVIKYDHPEQDYLGYYTKKNGILIQGLAIDEASGAVPQK